MYFLIEVAPETENAAIVAIEAARGGWIVGRERGLILSDKNIVELGVEAEVTPLTESEAASCITAEDVYGGSWAQSHKS